MPNNLFTKWSRDSKQKWFGISDNLKKDIVKATLGNKDSPQPPRPPPRSNPRRKAYYSDGNSDFVDVFGDIPDDYQEDQDADFQDADFQEEDLNDPDMRAYMQECYKAYKTDSTQKQPPVKNQGLGPDGKPLQKLLDMGKTHIAAIMGGKSTKTGKSRNINKHSWCLHFIWVPHTVPLEPQDYHPHTAC